MGRKEHRKEENIRRKEHRKARSLEGKKLGRREARKKRVVVEA